MFRVPRLLAPLSVAAVFAVAAPAAHAVDTVNFPDDGDSRDHGHHHGSEPGLAHRPPHGHRRDPRRPRQHQGLPRRQRDGARTPRSASTASATRATTTPATTSPPPPARSTATTCTTTTSRSRSAGGNTFSADLPKGELIDFDQVAVAVGIVGQDSALHQLRLRRPGDRLPQHQPGHHRLRLGRTGRPGRHGHPGPPPGRAQLRPGERDAATTSTASSAASVSPPRCSRTSAATAATSRSSSTQDADDQPLAAGHARTTSRCRRPASSTTAWATAGQPVQRHRRRHDHRGPDGPVRRHAGAQHDRPNRRVQLVDHRQRRR